MIGPDLYAEAISFDRSFAITYALKGIAILIGLAGVAATFSAQTVARAKEFGMMRHVGMSQGEIVAMLAIEGALLGLVGMAAGSNRRDRPQPDPDPRDKPAPFNRTMTTSMGVAIALIGTALRPPPR